MIKIGFVTTPLHDANAVRGVGFYTRRLLPELKKQAKNFGVEILEVDSLGRLDQLGQLEIIHYPYFDLFKHTLPIIKNAKTIVTIHDVMPLEFPDHFPPGIRGWFNLQLQKLALANVDRVITVSYHCVKTIYKYLGIPHAKLKLIYEAADPIFKHVSKPKNKYHLPGDINYNKNIPNLITAARLAKLPLVMVGRQAKELEKMDLSHPELKHLQGMSLQNVRRLGFVADAELVDIYNLATVYCQPSLADGFGLPVVEALACATPVACSRTSSLPEVAGDAATYFDPTDIKDMARAIKNAKSNHGPTQATKFSWAKAAAETLQVYQEALNKY
ncbi:MAG: Glycosyl transferase group 1 [Candidatus Amesbacteria bacterium GW2011_GWA1_47_20]|uniref:Glycosyl transferase group 1 n=1 Tax=Candidatus Amesbacteria bacterium GW2011_GWA1_47_20 TaxID=1618354 RepID=A0A0G1SL91_9BACT|nr:MAG: Glycosyl transferase group 1 [Candidatus Amesbacteria bacterium GW2011_GWA1_47_20]